MFNFNILKRIERTLNAMIKKCKCSTESIYTTFNLSTLTDYGCVPSTEPPLDQTIYHNGEAADPQIGDTIWTDPAGTIPLVSPSASDMYYLGDLSGLGSGDGANWILTDENGIVVSYSCK